MLKGNKGAQTRERLSINCRTGGGGGGRMIPFCSRCSVENIYRISSLWPPIFHLFYESINPHNVFATEHPISILEEKDMRTRTNITIRKKKWRSAQYQENPSLPLPLPPPPPTHPATYNPSPYLSTPPPPPYPPPFVVSATNHQSPGPLSNMKTDNEKKGATW